MAGQTQKCLLYCSRPHLQIMGLCILLCQSISAFVAGPERTLITLHLDLYRHALQIQQSVGNTNWILHAGILHIACMLLAKQLMQVAASTHVPLTVAHKLLLLFVGSMEERLTSEVWSTISQIV